MGGELWRQGLGLRAANEAALFHAANLADDLNLLVRGRGGGLNPGSNGLGLGGDRDSHRLGLLALLGGN